jgi:hypothetical protein
VHLVGYFHSYIIQSGYQASESSTLASQTIKVNSITLRERERERERKCVSVCARMRVRACVRVRVREGEVFYSMTPSSGSVRRW